MAELPRTRWMMGGVTNEGVEHYLYQLAPARDAVLAEMEQVAAERNIPIVGPLVGRLFYQVATAIGAKRVFELGSAIGYSTIWWARAVGESGRVVYTDGNRKNADQARQDSQQGQLAQQRRAAPARDQDRRDCQRSQRCEAGRDVGRQDRRHEPAQP